VALLVSIAIWVGMLYGLGRILLEATQAPPRPKPIEEQIVRITPPPTPPPIQTKHPERARSHPHPVVHRRVVPVVHQAIAEKPQKMAKREEATASVEPEPTPAPEEPVASAAPSEPPSPDTGPPGGGRMGARTVLRPIPEVPDEFRQDALHAVAIARFHVAADGTATVDMLQATANPHLNQWLLDALAKWRFFPAIEDGKPIASTIEIRIPIEVK